MRNTAGISSPQRPQIGTRPDEAIRLRQHHPGTRLIKAKAPLGGGGDFNGEPGIGGGRVRDRQNRHHPLAGAIGRHQDDRAWAILDPFLPAANMFRLPQIAVADHQAGNRNG
jgi:hypothetical protein